MIPLRKAAAFACNKVCQAKAKLAEVSVARQMTAGETLSAVRGGVRERHSAPPD